MLEIVARCAALGEGAECRNVGELSAIYSSHGPVSTIAHAPECGQIKTGTTEKSLGDYQEVIKKFLGPSG